MSRIDSLLANPLYNDYLGKIAAKEVARKFCRHDLQHLVDTARITYILLLEHNNGALRGLTKDIVYAAALLHDIGRWVEYETGEDHALASANLAVPILQAADFVDEEVAIIYRGILEHRICPAEPSPLGYFLYQGDKLSRPCYACNAIGDCYKFFSMEMKERLLIY